MSREGYRAAHFVALLLPSAGALKAVAQPIRDGFLAAYFADSNPQRPQVRTYDSGDTPQQAVAAYQQAVADGADRVVGPLRRDAVSAVFAQGRLPVPVLTLNQPEHGEVPPPGSAAFGLTPDTEAAQAAEHMLERGITPRRHHHRDRRLGRTRGARVPRPVRESQWRNPRRRTRQGRRGQLFHNDPTGDDRRAQRRHCAAAAGRRGAARRRRDGHRLSASSSACVRSRHACCCRSSSWPATPACRCSRRRTSMPADANPGHGSRSRRRRVLRRAVAVRRRARPAAATARSRACSTRCAAPARAVRDGPRCLLAAAVPATGCRSITTAYLPGATGQLSEDDLDRIQRLLIWARFDNGMARPINGGLQMSAARAQ